jgi:hypothetical protein
MPARPATLFSGRRAAGTRAFDSHSDLFRFVQNGGESVLCKGEDEMLSYRRELHEFDGRLVLRVGDHQEVLPFRRSLRAADPLKRSLPSGP